jgi:hypothetical protein
MAGKTPDSESSTDKPADPGDTTERVVAAGAPVRPESSPAPLTGKPADTAAKPGNATEKPTVGSGEFRSSSDRRDGLLSGITAFSVKRVRYSNVNGIGIFEGDINLGAVDKLEKERDAAGTIALHSNLTASGRGAPNPNIQFSVAITGQRFRWPGALIPYETDPSIQAIVDAAIAHWQERTGVRFVARTPANASSHPNFVSFEVGDGCFSAVGMQGGKQTISIGLGCGVGQAIHEIGHSVGLWHEQSREDRDQFIRISWENILPNMEHNFDQHISDGDDIGPYDYGSIMHYPALAFSANGLPTITALGGQPIGQRDALSESDIAAVRELYPGAVSSASHMYTSLILELASAIRDQGYRSEGVGFYAWTVALPGTVPMYRLSNPQGKQIYTTSATEAVDASNKGFVISGLPCYVLANPVAGSAPLFRLGNSNEQDSFVTTSVLEAQQATAHGYTGQGVAGHVLSSYVVGAVPVYRLSKSA